MDTLEIRPRVLDRLRGKVLPGHARTLCGYDVYLDGKPLRGLVSVKIELAIDEPARVWLELLPGASFVKLQAPEVHITTREIDDASYSDD